MQSLQVTSNMQQELSYEEKELEKQLELLRAEIQKRKKRSRMMWNGSDIKEKASDTSENDRKIVGKFTLYVTQYEW